MKQNPRLKTQARTLRRDSTPAERQLWQALRNSQLNALKFRRQHPIGPYILDFYCARANLAIEVDGPTHTNPEKDAERDRHLAHQGIHTIRVQNQDVLKNLPGVLEHIATTVATRIAAQQIQEDPTPPTPSPSGRGSG